MTRKSKAQRRAARQRKAQARTVDDQGPTPEVTVTRVAPQNRAEVVRTMTGAYPPEP